MKKTPNLELFDTISKFQNQDRKFISTLSVDEMKSLSPFLLMKWLCCVNDKNQILSVNQEMNKSCFAFYKHPKLQFNLLLASINSTSKPTWIKRPKKASSSLINKMIMDYYECSSKDAKVYMNILTKTEIMEMISVLGIDKENLSKLKREVKSAFS